MPGTRHPLRLAFLLALFTTVACEGSPSTPDGDDGGGDTDGTIDQLHDVPFEPNPLDVAYAADDAHTVSDTVSAAEGATLTTTDAAGTTYTLVIPADALMYDVEVRMTPLSGVTGFPLSGGMDAGVHLEPNGLRMILPATLTIETAGGLDAGDVSGFGFDGDGGDFHLRPADFEGDVAQLELFHFSSAGVGTGTAADRAAQQQRVPSDYAAYAEQRVSEILTRARQRALEDPDGDDFTAEELAAIDEIVEGWYDIVVKPALVDGAVDCDALREASSLFFAWARQIELLGMQTPSYEADHDEGEALWLEGIDNCVEEYYATCVAEHDVGQTLNFLAIERMRQLLTLSAGEKAMEYFYKCSTFELELISTMTMTDYATTEVTSSTLFVGLPYFPTMIAESGTMESYEATFHLASMVEGCTHVGTVHATEAPRVRPDIWIGIIPRDSTGAPTGKADVSAMRLDVWPGTLQSLYREQCPDGNGGFVEHDIDIGTPHFLGWLTFHVDEMTADANSFFSIELTADELPDGSLFGRRTYTNSNEAMTETTVLNLWHRPEQDGRTATGPRPPAPAR